jgi:hypothetical protein
MKFYHNNSPISPVIIDKGNSVILYSTKSKVSLSDNSIDLTEVTVKGKKYFVEARQIKPGLEIGILSINNVPCEFLLKQVAPLQESAIIFNPFKRKVDIDHKDVGLYYLNQTEPVPKKESENSAPPTFKNYDTESLVYEAIKPLSAYLLNQSNNQQTLIKDSLKFITENSTKQESILKEHLDSNLKKIKESHELAIETAWSKTVTEIKGKIHNTLTEHTKAFDKSVRSEVNSLATKLITEYAKLHKEELLKENSTQFSKLSSETYKWLAEQMASINNDSTQLLLEKNNEADTYISNRVDEINQSLTQRLNEVTSKLSENYIQAESAIINRFDHFKNQADTISDNINEKVNSSIHSFDKKLKDTLELISASKNEITKQVQEGTLQIEQIINTSKIYDEFKANIVELFTEEIKTQKQYINVDLRKYIDGQIALVRTLALRLADTGGGTVAVQYANGGTMNGNLTIVGSISAQNYLGLNITIPTNYLPLSGGTVTGNVTITDTLSVTRLYATSAVIEVQDVTLYELSTFNVQGNATITEFISAGGSINTNSTFLSSGVDIASLFLGLTQLSATGVRFKANKGFQWYNTDTGLWHTKYCVGDPPQDAWDAGEP